MVDVGVLDMDPITALQFLTALLGLPGNLLINRKNPTGFKLWIVSNALAVGTMLWAGLWGLAIMFAAYLCLAIDGLVQWQETTRN